MQLGFQSIITSDLLPVIDKMCIQFSKEWVCHYYYVDHILICILSETEANLEPQHGKGSSFQGFWRCDNGGIMSRPATEGTTSDCPVQPPQNTRNRWQISTRNLFLVACSHSNGSYFPFSSLYLNVQEVDDFFSMLHFYKALKLKFYASVI